FLGGLRGCVLFAEAINATLGVHQLLLAGVVRVAGGADFDVEVAARGARLDLGAAGADDVRGFVLGMGVRLHRRGPRRKAAKLKASNRPRQAQQAASGSSNPGTPGCSWPASSWRAGTPWNRWGLAGARAGAGSTRGSGARAGAGALPCACRTC